MKSYIGTKQVQATPMNRAHYNEYRGWELPGNENGADEGYLVEYLDGGKPNHPGHAGYISWSPKEQFENAYRATDGLTFGLAIEALKLGQRVARNGWNGKGMWIEYVANDGAMYIDRPLRPYLMMATAQGDYVPWVASQSDVLSEDWVIVE